MNIDKAVKERVENYPIDALTYAQSSLVLQDAQTLGFVHLRLQSQ